MRTRTTLLLLSLILPPLTGALADTPLQGPAFSDPTHRVKMSEEWAARPIHDPALPAGLDLIVTLDQHLYPALAPMIEAYAAERGLKVSVKEGTCGISAGALAERQADVGGFCCPAGAADRLPGLRFHTLGIASLALLVHPDNPLEGVTLEQARDLFGGLTTRWSRLSPEGPPGLSDRVEAVGRLHCKKRPGHWRLLLDHEDLFSPRLREVSTIPDMVAAVAREPTAIGFETLWMVEKNRAAGSVKTLRVNGAAATDRDALVRGGYPLYRVYNVTTWEEETPRARRAEALIKHLKERFGQVEAKYGFVPSERLRATGWRFAGDELIGEPEIQTRR